MKHLLTIGAAFCAICIVSSALAQGALPIQKLLQNDSPKIVTVKIITRTMMGEGSNTQNTEGNTYAEGVVVSPSGLVMLSTSAYSTDVFQQLLGSLAGSGFEMKTVPTGFKITIGDESKEYNGFLAATDSILGLSFVQIEGLDGRALTAEDMNSSAQASLGEEVYCITRLQKGYNYAPYLHTARIGGSIVLPRPAFLLTETAMPLGLPVYNAAGQVLGVMTLLKPTVTPTESGSNPFGMLGSILGGGGSPLQFFLVPSSAVNAVVLQAETRAKALLAKREAAAVPVKKTGK